MPQSRQTRMAFLGRWLVGTWGPFHLFPAERTVYFTMVATMVILGFLYLAIALILFYTYRPFEHLPSVTLWSGPAFAAAAPIISLVLMLLHRMFIWPFVKSANERQMLLCALRQTNMVARPTLTIPTAFLAVTNVVATGTNAPSETPVIGVAEVAPTLLPLTHMA